jgi:hypothetical protein
MSKEKSSPLNNVEENISTVVRVNLCVRCPLEIKGKRITGVGGVSDKEAYTVHTINIISQWQYFVSCCFSSYVGNVFGLHNTYMHLFPFYPQASDIGKTHSLVPGAVYTFCASKIKQLKFSKSKTRSNVSIQLAS